MATDKLVNVFTMPASTDLSTKQYYVVTFDSNAEVKLADDADQKGATGNNEPLFILVNKPAAQYENAELAGIGSIVKAKLGATTAAGDPMTTDGSGQAIPTSTAGDWCFAIALEDGASGDLRSILICGPFMYEAS